MGLRILIVAGELSGDRNGASLAKEILKQAPDAEFFAVGGPQLACVGARLVFDSSSWGAVGFFESLAKTPRIYPALWRLKSWIARRKPDLIIPIDFRVFNFQVVKAAFKNKIPAVYYFAPVTWGGQKSRRFQYLKEKNVVSLITFPFGIDNYKAVDAKFRFIGHPLIDMIEDERRNCSRSLPAREEMGKPVIGLMPGSRWQEVKRLVPVFLESARKISERFPAAVFKLSCAHPMFMPWLRRRIERSGLNVEIWDAHPYAFMDRCDLLLLCSGTVTLEAAILRKPMIITYKLSRPTAWLARKLLKNLKWVGMPNILAQESIVPELLQENCTPEAIFEQAVSILSDTRRRSEMLVSLEKVRLSLGGGGALKRAADVVLAVARNQPLPRFQGAGEGDVLS